MTRSAQTTPALLTTRAALLLVCAALLAPASASAQDAAKKPAASATAKLGKGEMVALLKKLDARQRNVGDYKALVFIDQKRKGKNELVYQAAIYRRDSEKKMVILFLKPKSEAGKGYLRLDGNFFIYDPTVGKWERRTERESIGGTDSRRRDFDASSFAEDYDPTYVATEKLGRFTTHHIKLTVKTVNGKKRDVAYPVMHVWLDAKSDNTLKVQEYALSGRLMRTSYYPKWMKVKSPSGKLVYIPKQIRIFDEVEKQNKTTIIMRKVDLQKLPGNIFTKAWLESKSR